MIVSFFPSFSSIKRKNANCIYSEYYRRSGLIPYIMGSTHTTISQNGFNCVNLKGEIRPLDFLPSPLMLKIPLWPIGC